MVTRNLRRRARRSKATREPYDRVLIVCEGRKTEPFYFNELVDFYSLSLDNVKVVDHGSDPLQVVRRAKELQRRERQLRNKYDKVYCVFDRDEHPSFDQASNEAEASGLKLARSWPCFEYWLLLHFCYSRKPYAKAGDRSPAKNCINDLTEHFPEYSKTKEGIFQVLESRLETAKVGALRAIKEAQETEELNPSTEVHELVSYLQSLKPSDS